MTHDITTQTERDAMTPARLSLILGVQIETLRKASKIVCTGTWGKNSALSEADTNSLIFYYAALGNETAKKLAENRRKETEKVAVSGGNGQMAKIQPAEIPAEKKETEKKASRWYFIADAIFFLVLIMTGAEVWFFLTTGMKADAPGAAIIRAWGMGLWITYAAAISISLLMAKDASIPKTAEWGFTALVILEFFGAVCHFSMAKYLVTEAAKNGLMPFTYAFPSQAMEGEWYSVTAPLWIAGAISAVLSGIVIYAVWIRLSITKELSK